MRQRHSKLSVAAFLAAAVVGLTSACATTLPGHAQPKAGLAVCDAVVMFVLDISLSMEATDVAPTRLAAATAAAKDYAQRLPPRTQLGLITFAGTASVQVRPSADRVAFARAIDAVRLAERTATGEAIFSALAAIDVLHTVAPIEGPRRIILVSDGKQTVPADLDDTRGAFTAAREAKRQYAGISAISLGTTSGVIEIPGAQGTDQVRVPTDEDSLREVGRLSGGDFHSATTLAELTAALAGSTCAP
ncbi:VWA domain-containing protein [Nocardia caishijiensis]|uniref:Mg-chelatase subunit ChlD n=1 Tax=Nocardia caishijiensis TaxID=184756 RepID=A0ABQ6YG88_9NOCA|nr:VWA domain-containing protein [Nocardia caishijiensis]KAF0844808.1 Mg-chelatase subunit ChlD [Nocardia caishijiensis]